MKYDEFFFLNQQLASMLREGIPLEGALKRLCEGMSRGPLRREFETLEADLERGIPFKEALEGRALPPFYLHMLKVGLQTHDFPGMLTLLADYYQKSNVLWTRLKGLMFYPILLLFGCVGLSFWFAHLHGEFAMNLMSQQGPGSSLAPLIRLGGPAARDLSAVTQTRTVLNIWLPPVGFAVLGLTSLLVVAIRPVRRRLKWRLPVFREASLSQFASAMSLLLKGGTSLAAAIDVMAPLEQGTQAGQELRGWQKRSAEGHTRFSEIVGPKNRIFPPLFVWLVSSGGEDMAAGFRRAGEIYYQRASFRSELLLTAALPVSLLLIGLMLMGQVYPFMNSIHEFFRPMFSL